MADAFPQKRIMLNSDHESSLLVGMSSNAIPNATGIRVRTAIERARRGIEQYLWLMRSLHETDVSADRNFQRRYNGFYRVRQRSAGWYSTYFTLLEAHKNTGVKFDEILDELWNGLWRYEPSFTSKLVATINPNLPVWDRFVLMNTGLRPPSYTDAKRCSKAKKIYRQICAWYLDCLESPEGRQIIEIFDEEVTEYRELTDLKKLDFVLWQTRS